VLEKGIIVNFNTRPNIYPVVEEVGVSTKNTSFKGLFSEVNLG
jgi:hypothetical protein